MSHLLIVSCLVLTTFVLLILRRNAEIAYVLVAWFPPFTFLIAIAHESVRGIQQTNHQLLHVAYDSSYALLLLGICIVLLRVIKHKRIYIVLAATFVAGVPLAHIFITQPK
jgi:hypothetical protein